MKIYRGDTRGAGGIKGFDPDTTPDDGSRIQTDGRLSSFRSPLANDRQEKSPHFSAALFCGAPEASIPETD